MIGHMLTAVKFLTKRHDNDEPECIYRYRGLRIER